MVKKTKVALRRQPEQERSRSGVNAILDATAELLSETGVDQITITAIANKAGLSKAAVYRYFPNKATVLRELAQQTYQGDNKALAILLDPETEPEYIIGNGFRDYLDKHKAEPFRVQLRAAVRADPELSLLDLKDSRTNAKAVATALVNHSPEKVAPDVEDRLLLIIEMLDSVIRLTSIVEPSEAERITDDFITLAISHLLKT